MVADLLRFVELDAKYLGGFYCISRRLTLLSVTNIDIVVDIKRHADLDFIDKFCFLFLGAHVFTCSFIACLLVCLLYFILFVLFSNFVYFLF